MQFTSLSLLYERLINFLYMNIYGVYYSIFTVYNIYALKRCSLKKQAIFHVSLVFPYKKCIVNTLWIHKKRKNNTSRLSTRRDKLYKIDVQRCFFKPIRVNFHKCLCTHALPEVMICVEISSFPGFAFDWLSSGSTRAIKGHVISVCGLIGCVGE